MRITAHHAHLFPTQVRPAGDIAHLLSTLDACGIEQCVAFALFPAQMHRQDISPSRWLHDEIVPHGDRLFGFGVIDFARGHLQEQVDEIAQLGFRGIKLHPAYQHFHVFGPEAREVYARAEELGLFLSFHTGVHFDRIAHYDVLLFDEIAWHYRKLRFSMEHIGGYSFVRPALAVLANNDHDKEHPQVYGGFTSIFETERNYLWYLSPEERALAVRMAGENGILFGLDFPYNDVAKIRQGIEAVLAMDVSETCKEKILGGNLRGILGIAE